MTETDQSTTVAHRGQDIIISGKTWRPRHRIAKENVGCADRTLRRKNPKTALICGIAYCPVEETLADLVAEASRANQSPPPTPRSRSKRARR